MFRVYTPSIFLRYSWGSQFGVPIRVLLYTTGQPRPRGLRLECPEELGKGTTSSSSEGLGSIGCRGFVGFIGVRVGARSPFLPPLG